MDAHIRQLALDPAQSFIVQAPAGSGKTEILVQRYLSLLATAVKHPEEILAITFTKKAAHEMRTRILNALEKVKQQDTDHMQSATLQLAKTVLARCKKENWNLLENPNRLSIQTIDALCMRLTKQMPILSGLGGVGAITQNTNAIYVQSVEAMLATLDEATPYQDALLTLFKHFDNRYQDILDVMVEMLKKRDQWLPYMVNPDQADLLRTHLESHLENIHFELLENARHHLSVISARLLPLAQYAGFDMNDKSICDLLLTKEGTYRKQVDKRQGFPAGVKNDYKQQMHELLEDITNNKALRLALILLREAPPTQYTEESWQFLKALFKILPLISAHLMVCFAQNKKLDFTEISMRALHALGEEENPTDLALVLDHQLQHILVDEFQDTSMMQFRLLEKMTSGWQPNDGRTLFLVGDPMQSIYRFRQANVGLFLKAKQYGIGQIQLTPLQLCMNFRQHPMLIDLMNQIMPQIMPTSSDIAMGAIPFTPASATKPQDETGAFECILADDAENEAQCVLQQLQEIRLQHPNWTIAILVRARKSLTEILPLLKTCNIPYQAVEIESLEQRGAIKDVLAITRALLQMDDKIAWLSLLRAPFCGLDLHGLEILTQNENDRIIWDVLQDNTVLELLPIDAQTCITRFVNLFAPVLYARGRLPLAHWVQSAWIALGGAFYTATNDEADILSFYQLLDFLEKEYDVIDAHILEKHLEKCFTDQTASALNPVQVMTIHKAKGLEFDAVLLPGLSRSRPPNKQPLLRYAEHTLDAGTHCLLAPIHAKTAQADPIYQYLARMEKYQENYETQRLLYVALTRAKQQLYLFAVQDPDRKNAASQSLYALIAPTLSLHHCEQSLRHCERSEAIQVSMHNHDLNLDYHATHAPHNDPHRIPLNWQHPQPWNDWINQHIPETKENNVDPSAYTTHTITRKHIGTLLHRILKQMVESNIHTQDPQRYRIQLLELGVPSPSITQAVEILTQAITAMLSDSKGQWLMHPHPDGACEYSLHTHHKNKYTRVTIDRTFIFENERWIIDYKSGDQQDESQYIAQLQHYAQVMRHIDARNIRLGLYFPLTTTWKEIPCNI